jgi:hypothetical protein
VTRRILLCDTQRPFQKDPGAVPVDALAEQLRQRGFDVDLARLPAAGLSAPHLSVSGDGVRRHLFDATLAWRLLDLTAGAKQAVHLLLATRFPAYVAHHPNKVVWLLPDEGPQPGATELVATEPVATTNRRGDPEAEGLRRSMDRRAFAEARRLFAGSPERVREVKRETGLDAVLLPIPAGDVREARDAGDPAWDDVVEQLTSTL